MNKYYYHEDKFLYENPKAWEFLIAYSYSEAAYVEKVYWLYFQYDSEMRTYFQEKFPKIQSDFKDVPILRKTITHCPFLKKDKDLWLCLLYDYRETEVTNYISNEWVKEIEETCCSNDIVWYDSDMNKILMTGLHGTFIYTNLNVINALEREYGLIFKELELDLNESLYVIK